MSSLTNQRPLIKMDQISLIRDSRVILENVSLEIMKHDFQTIIGPNGAGKSTLLKIMMGLIQPKSGNVFIDKSCKIGYMPQRFVPSPAIPFTVNGFLNLRTQAPDSDIEKSIHLTQIEKIQDTPLYSISGGEMQRVLLARALLHNPDLLILDEPAQSLDLSGQLAFYKLLENIYKENEMSIVMVSHDLHLVMASTRKVICLFHHICCEGAPSAVTKSREFFELFGEEMQEMMAIYQHHHDHDHKHCNTSNGDSSDDR